MKTSWRWLAAVLCGLMSGCVAPRARPAYATADGKPVRDALVAQEATARGLEAVKKQDWKAAEAAFREALAADLFYPAAHNNLGLALMQQGGQRTYEAAWEFQYAAKLLPESAEPRHNLGTLLERVGRVVEAEKEYTEALTLDPENVAIMGHLARVRVKRDENDDKTLELLKKLAMAPEANGWDRWARQWLLRLDTKQEAE